MRAMAMAVVLAVLGVFSTGSWAADVAAEVAALHAVDDAWAKAYNGGDVEGVVALYADHALLMPPGSPGMKGKKSIRDFFTKDIAESQKGGVAFSLGGKPDGGVSGDLGWVSGTYAVKDKAGKVLDTGKYLSVSKKKGGKWLYVRDTWNSDGAAPKQ